VPVDGHRSDPTPQSLKNKDTTETFDVEPMAAWMAIEDLWLRLVSRFTVKLSCQHGIHELTFVGIKTATLEGHASRLLNLVADPNTYSWHVQEHRGQFIDGIDYQGSELILQLKPLTHIQRWPDGEQMACEVKSFMLRLQGLVSRGSTSTLANAGGASL